MLDVDPPVLEHEAFGRLLWDDDLQWYRGRMGLQGEVVDLSISPFTEWVPSEIPTRLAEPQHLIDAVIERLALVQPRLHDLKLYAAATSSRATTPTGGTRETRSTPPRSPAVWA